MSEYLCMDCKYHMKCPVNAGIMCDFVTTSTITYIERLHRYHILVNKCEKFEQREMTKGEILPLPLEYYEMQITRPCNICGTEFVVTKHDKTICSNPKCKKISLRYRRKGGQTWRKEL